MEDLHLLEAYQQLRDIRNRRLSMTGKAARTRDITEINAEAKMIDVERQIGIPADVPEH